jgi:osmotically-inducible protein OsmY
MKNLMSYVSALLLMLMFSTTTFANVTHDVAQATIDTGITAEVKALLFEKKMFDSQTNLNPMDVHVDTTNGEVMLTGHVKDEQQKTRAAEIAQSAKGVKSVNNQLVIK